MKKTKIFVVVSHSLGEIDILLPIFFEQQNSGQHQIKIIFTIKKIYKQFCSNKFYIYCFKYLKIKSAYCQMLNKFDHDLNKNRSYDRLNKYYNYLLQLRFIFLNLDIFTYDYFMHESSDQKTSTKIIKIIATMFKKKILVYHHGHSFNQPNPYLTSQNKKVNEKYLVFLLFTCHNQRWAKSLGYNNNLIIGFPKFYKNWVNFVKKYALKNILEKKYVIIYSRNFPHEYYMGKTQYNFLINSSYKAIRDQLPNIKIYIKPHPREDIKKLNLIIKQKKFKSTFVSNEHSAVLANNAFFTISFFCSSIMDGLAQNIPSVEFYVESERFREMEPTGSMYKELGIHSASTKKDLSNFIEKVIDKSYKFPSIINFLQNEKNLNIFNSIKGS